MHSIKKGSNTVKLATRLFEQKYWIHVKQPFFAHLMKKQNATKARLVSNSSRKLSMKLFCHMMSKWKAYAAAKVSKVERSACAPAKSTLLSNLRVSVPYAASLCKI